MMKTNGKVNVSDIFRAKQFDACGKESRVKSAVDRAIESLCVEHRLFVEDIMRCDVKEEIASELLRSCTSIENALTTEDKHECGIASPHQPIPEKDQDDEISIFNIDVNYVDICLDIGETSKVDEVFKEKKERLEQKIQQLNGSDSSAIEELETCMVRRDEVIISQSALHKNVLDLCKSIRQIEVDMMQITNEVCVTPQTTEATVVRFDCKDELQKIIKLQRKVDKVRNMSMLKGCHLLMCREGNKRITKENALLKEDLKKLIAILRDLDREYKKIQSDLCDSDNISKKTSNESIKENGKRSSRMGPHDHAESPKKEAVIVKPDVDKRRKAPRSNEYVDEPNAPSKIRVHESTIPSDDPSNQNPTASVEIEIRVHEGTIPGDAYPDHEPAPKNDPDETFITDKTPAGQPPHSAEIIPYEAEIPGDIPFQLPQDETKRDQSLEKETKKGGKKLMPDDSTPIFKDDRMDEDLKLEIRSFDNEIQSDTTDELPFGGKKPESKRKKVDEQPRTEQKDMPKEHERTQHEEREEKHKKHAQEEEEEDKHSLPPHTEKIRVHDGSLPGDYVDDGNRYGEIIPLVPHEAQILGDVSMRSSLRQKESHSKAHKRSSPKSARFASSEQESDDEEDEKLSVEDNKVKKIQGNRTDKPPPGGAAGGVGRPSLNQNRPTGNTKGNSGSSTRRQSREQRNSYNGGKRNSIGVANDESQNNQTVGDFIRNGKAGRKKGHQSSPDYLNKVIASDQRNTEELIGDQPINVSSPGIVNDDHMMTVMHQIDQAIKNQETFPAFAKTSGKGLDQVKMMNDWKGIFEQYQQAYSVLVTAKHDYQEKYEATLKELAKYKEDYDLLRKANSGAEEIVDEISALKRLNSALEQRINSTLHDLERKEHENQSLVKKNENFKGGFQKSFDSIACSSMESLRFIQKISQLESKIAFLTNQNEIILRKYEDSQQKLNECEKNLRDVTEKMLKPPKNIVIPLIPTKDASYKEWANYSKYITERLNDFQVALARSNFMLKLVENEKAKLRKENDSQKCALQSSFESLKRVQAEQSDPSLTQQVELLAKEVEKQANDLKVKEEESTRLIEANKSLSERVEKMEETVKYYRKCVERLNFMKEGIARWQSSVSEENQRNEQTRPAEPTEGSNAEHIHNQNTDASDLIRRPNIKAICLTSSALHKIVQHNSKRVRWNFANSSNNEPGIKPIDQTQVSPSSSDCHEFRLLHNFLQKEISKCIGKIHEKGCPQPIRQELEEIKNNLEWSKRKVNEMMGTEKKKTNDQNALQLQKVCEKMIQSGAESLSPKELVFLYNVVYTAGKERSEKTKSSRKVAAKEDNFTGMKKWKDLEADINLTRHMLDKLRSSKK